MRIKGEKGCFGSSCKVLTPEGEQYIDILLIGDEVYCYDDSGELQTGIVREVREHENQTLYHFSYWDGELSATRNHWVQNQFGAFVEIGTLTCEDAIMDRNGHLCPFIGSVPTGRDTVYSIIVEPYHTLIVNGIRAHNGGLGLEPYQTAISGEKGSKGGGGTVRPAVESKNTLQSRATAAVLDLISEGEIEGLVPAPAKISGKTTSPYERSYRIALPEGGAPWDVKLERVTADSTKTNLQNKTFWSSYTELIEAKLTYPDSALIGISIDAQQFGGSIPTRAYEVKGLIINIPSNYDPDTRVYTGVWDGTFQTAWSDNPAWVLYDLLTHKRYGLGNSLSAGEVDKWSLYTIAQYCDELVDDGFGGEEPRMTFNAVINSQQAAYDVVNAIASAFRGMLYWGVALWSRHKIVRLIPLNLWGQPMD